MTAFEQYMNAQDKVESAKNLVNYASAKLDLAHIRCRLAEIESQSEPLDTLSGGDRKIRDLMYAAAFYVVVGRHLKET